MNTNNLKADIEREENSLDKLENTINKLRHILKDGGLGMTELDSIGASIFSLREKTYSHTFNLIILRSKLK
jgi:hypothetical protein